MISKYETFKISIKNYIQTCGMDIGIVYFIMKDIFNEIESLYYAQINRELLEESQHNNEEIAQDEEQTESDERCL